MSFKWADWLKLAESLQANPSSPGPPEAALRTAVGRAYFAVFCTARALLDERRECEFSHTGRDHSVVRKYFRDSPQSLCFRIHQNYDRLYDFRSEVDYEDAVPGLPEVAKTSVILARQTLELLDHL